MPVFLLSRAERLQLDFDETTIYYHRLTYAEREAITHQATDRGTVRLGAWQMESAKRAVDGWDNLYGADGQPIAVPLGPTDDVQRERIAAIVEHFPLGVIQAIANAAYTDTPEELKKSWQPPSAANSNLPTNGPAANSPAPIAADSAPRMG